MEEQWKREWEKEREELQKTVDFDEIRRLFPPTDPISNIKRLTTESNARNAFNATYNPYKQPDVDVLPALKLDTKKFQVAEKQADQAFDRMINAYCQGLTLQKKVWEEPQFAKGLTDHKQNLRKFAESGNPQALFLLGVASRWGVGEPIDKDKSGELMKKSAMTGHPIGCMGYGFHLQQLKDNRKEALPFFKKAADYREVLSLIQVGLQHETSNPKLAYSYYKLAADLGCLIGYMKVGQMYTKGNYVKQDHLKAGQYFKKAADLGKKQAETLVALTNMSVAEKQQNNKNKEEHLLTTKLQEAMLICKFTEEQTKFEEMQNNPFAGSFSFAFPTPELEPSNLYKKDALVLYNLLPCMDLASKHLLVENPKCGVEKLCIYSWERIPASKINLLKLPGTKLILTYYNRKMARDGLPIYRVDNSDLVEIYPPEEPNTHTLTFEKMKEAGRVLFSASHFEQCIKLYNQMMRRGCKEIAILNSNLSICHMKLGKHEQALKCAKQCLKLESKHPKALYMVALMLFRLGNIRDAELASKELVDNQESRELKKMIEEKLMGEQINSDFSLDTYRKKKPSRSKQLSYELTNSNRPSIQINLLEILPFFNKFEEYVRAILSIKGGNYQELIRGLFGLMLGWKLETHDPLKLTQLATFFYGFLNAKRTPLQFSAQDYAPVVDKEFVGGGTYGEEKYRAYVNRILSHRMTFLENEVESAAIKLEEMGELEQAIKLYECFKDNNYVFSRNQAELLLATGKAKECSDLCTKVSIRLLLNEQEQTGMKRAFQIVLLAAKANYKLKDYEYSNSFCLKARYMHENPAPVYYIQSMNNLALNNKKQALQDAFKATEGEFQPEHTLHLCRLLIGAGRDKEAARILEDCYRKITTSKEVTEKKMWQKFCLKLQIQQASKHRQLKMLVQCCIRVLKLELRNVTFVEKRLWEELRNNPEDSEAILELVAGSKQLRFIGEELRSQWILLQKFENKSVTSEESIVRDCSDVEFADSIDPRKIHEEFLQIKRKTCQEPEPVRDDNIVIDLDGQLDAEFNGYRCSFYEHGKLHVILFSDKLGLDPKEEQQFIMAAGKGFCSRFYGSNGIKRIGNNYELKIKAGDRLIGQAKESYGRCVIAFEEKVGHTKAARTFRQA